ncbi:potassium channel family protein [Agarivorans sp. MS3-6]|uniref:potassium channel family protein n=1 Tax=Agarivorans sp. TSD2052 TaxID=2937286 RepID=UPI00200E838E|nr:potassium channel family protein [Agarivorans sp. TSD2052]UPW19386.1 potassium channel family protein [Agarivorans sp. TSD2052]
MKTNVNAFDLAIMLLSIIAIGIVSCLFFYPTDSELRSLLVTLDTLICCVFIAHFFSKMLRSNNPKRYFQHHWIDLLASIPMVEPLRFLRFIHAYKLISAISKQRQLFKKLLSRRIESTLAMILLIIFLIVLAGSVGILLAEGGEGGQIQNSGEALWWAIVTVSTVGYGDFVPVTDAGRILASIMIFTGVGFFGAISGLMSALLLRDDATKETRLERLIQQHQAEQKMLREQLSLIQKQLKKMQQRDKD